MPRHLARHAGLGSTCKASVLDRAWRKESLSTAVSSRAVLVVTSKSIQNLFLPPTCHHGIDLALVIILKEFVAVVLCEFFITAKCWTFNLCYSIGNEYRPEKCLQALFMPNTAAFKDYTWIFRIFKILRIALACTYRISLCLRET